MSDNKRRGKRPAVPNSNSEVENITDEVARLARRHGITTNAALRLMARRPGPSRRHHAVDRVLMSRDLMPEITKSLLSSNMARLAGTSRAMRDMYRDTQGGNVLSRDKRPKYVVVGPGNLKGLVRVPMSFKGLATARMSTGGGGRAIRPTRTPTAADRPQIIRTLSFLVGEYTIRDELETLHRGLVHMRDPASHDVRAFIDALPGDGHWYQWDHRQRDSLISRLSTRALYLILFVFITKKYKRR